MAKGDRRATFERGRVRDARGPEPSGCRLTGELIDTETVTISSEGGGWKSACSGNSLAAYPTARPVLRGGGGGDLTSLPDYPKADTGSLPARATKRHA